MTAPAHPTARVLDVTHLPDGTADSRALLWWGNLGMIVIEGSMFVMTIGTYLYLKTANLDWPPSNVPRPDLVLPSIGMGLLLVSIAFAVIADRAALRDDIHGIRLGLGLCTLTSVVFLFIRAACVAQLGFKWSDHAYGSIVWVMIGLHTLHVVTAGGECGVLVVYSFFRPLIKRQLLDVRCTAVYWYFVVLSWLPFYFIIYVGPWLVKKGT